MAYDLSGQWVDYFAPSRACGELLGLPQIWCDWGLHGHDTLQARLGRPWTDEWDADLARWVVRHCPELEGLCRSDLRLYHSAMGMISQFVLDDILYFLQYDDYKSRPAHLETRYSALERLLPPRSLQWVPSRFTLTILEEHVRVSRRVFA